MNESRPVWGNLTVLLSARPSVSHALLTIKRGFTQPSVESRWFRFRQWIGLKITPPVPLNEWVKVEVLKSGRVRMSRKPDDPPLPPGAVAEEVWFDNPALGDDSSGWVGPTTHVFEHPGD